MPTSFDFVEALQEREAIMADSGITDMEAAFKSSEEWRAITEAKHCLDWYSLQERRNYLELVQKHRGIEGRRYLESHIMQEWNNRKAAA